MRREGLGPNGSRFTGRGGVMRYDVAKHNADRVIRLPDNDIALRYRNGETVAEIARSLGVSNPTVRKSLLRSGVTMRKAARRTGKAAGANNPAWRGGRRQRPDGYWMVWTPEGERLEHRVIMERHLGRRLEDYEIVHHRDGNKSHNDIKNLEVMTQSDHARHHCPEMHSARYSHER